METRCGVSVVSLRKAGTDENYQELVHVNLAFSDGEISVDVLMNDLKNIVQTVSGMYVQYTGYGAIHQTGTSLTTAQACMVGTLWDIKVQMPSEDASKVFKNMRLRVNQQHLEETWSMRSQPPIRLIFREESKPQMAARKIRVGVPTVYVIDTCPQHYNEMLITPTTGGVKLFYGAPILICPDNMSNYEIANPQDLFRVEFELLGDEHQILDRLFLNKSKTFAICLFMPTQSDGEDEIVLLEKVKMELPIVHEWRKDAVVTTKFRFDVVPGSRVRRGPITDKMTYDTPKKITWIDELK